MNNPESTRNNPEGIYTICWEGHGYFGRSTNRLDLATAEREVLRLNRYYPHIRHWPEPVLPDTTVAPSMPDGPPPSLVARIYHAHAVDDMRSFDLVLRDVSVRDMRLLAQRLMRMSTQVRSLIDSKMGEK